MCLYHYPDVWYDYAEWHIKSGSTDAAIKVFQRALKAIPGISDLSFSFFVCERLISLFSLLCACCESFLFSQVYIAHTDSEMLKYAYAELEEARGAIQVFILTTWFSL